MQPNKSQQQARAEIAVGIDLGTTFSSVAYVDSSGRPASVPNQRGDVLTPSAVFVDKDEIVVGRGAMNRAVSAVDKYAESFKRDMGRAFYHRPIAGRRVPAEVLSALVLDTLREDAQRHLGPVDKAVITVPAYFDELRRKATQDAGRLAGWQVIDIINEPIAAALCCGCQQGMFGLRPGSTSGGQERVVVYDLGGGTFDVSVLEIDGTTFQTIATDGDVRLGGTEFDERLVEYLAAQFQAAHGVDPRSEPQDALQLWRDAQEMKHQLSDGRTASTVCFHAGLRMRIEVTRQQFEEMTQDLLERTKDTVDLVVRRAGLKFSRISRVITVGGATRMPMVSRMLRELTGKEPEQSAAPDEAVAHGAALYASALTRQAGAPGTALRCELINVNSHSLGVVGVNEKSGQRVNAIVIPRNTSVPARAVRSFQTLHEGQPSVAAPVVEGESECPDFCVALGECVIKDLPPNLPKGTRVEVEFRYAANGRLSVSARLPSIDQSATVDIQRSRSATEESLAKWRDILLGRASAPSGLTNAGAAAPVEETEVDLTDRSSILRRLDYLHARIGRLAVATDVPPAARPSRQAALAAADALKRAQQREADVTRRRAGAVGVAEAVRLGAECSKAQAAEQQAAQDCDFAYLVLGRECAGAGYSPPDSEADLAEVRRLIKLLERK